MKGICISILVIIQMAYVHGQTTYENIVFEGAGIRGLAYSGVVKGLEERNLLKDIKRVGGTSAGAITATMLSIGYSSEEVYRIISDTEFQKFNKGGFGIIGGSRRMKKRYGWYKHDKFEKWLAKLIEAKTGDSEITFAELDNRGFKELHVTGTSINKQEMIVFNSANYPTMKIKDAVKVSMSIPFYFGAMFVDSTGVVYNEPVEGIALDIVVDGGIVGNYPIGIFDEVKKDSSGGVVRVENVNTLGVRMDSEEQIKNYEKRLGLVDQDIRDLRSHISAFYIMVIENLNRNTLTKGDWERTISVSSVGIGPRIKKLSDEEKIRLMKSGEKAVNEFFNQ